jgi:hypothetical protein
MMYTPMMRPCPKRLQLQVTGISLEEPGLDVCLAEPVVRVRQVVRVAPNELPAPDDQALQRSLADARQE